ncbi:FAD-binding oxidoreductase [Pseudoruegeria sp. HB172150]|uniref:FAD-binding oxidoreductase n=1 Tax=Pseudoruegeria sp. HB172150 TaxID=2721164 RepID=UPI001555369A|nr:FAD-binding oxidoreductase [Pseudoruegeria sp. HB172150]
MRWKTAEYSGWGRAIRANGQMARPEKRAALTALMAEEPAPAIGMRRSYGDACLNDGGRAVHMIRLDKFLGFDAETGILTAEAGLTLGEITRVMAPRGWLPAVLPGTGFATVGGAIANDVHGKNHHNAGTFAQHVVAMTLLTPDGAEHRVTPETTPDLFRATVGGVGQTGIIASAEMRLKRVKSDLVTVTERRANGFDEFIAMLDSSDTTYSVGWIDATARGADLGRGLLEEAETAGGLVPTPKSSRTVPMNAPRFALSAPVVKLFNAMWYRRVPKSGHTVVKPINDFFFQLDRIHDWNRLYGKNGFHQFQCVVPLSAAAQLRDMLERISASGLASPLAVLKRTGEGRAGMMSFPMEGYTLAVDLRAQPECEALIKRLEDMTADAGGRIYFAKDALCGADRIQQMYPDLDAWRAEVAKHDPEGRMITDLVRRLKLREPA